MKVSTLAVIAIIFSVLSLHIHAIHVNVNVDVNGGQHHNNHHQHHNRPHHHKEHKQHPHHHVEAVEEHHLSPIEHRLADAQGSIKLYRNEIGVYVSSLESDPTQLVFHLAMLNDENVIEDRGQIDLQEVGTLMNRTFVALEDLSAYPFVLCESASECNAPHANILTEPLVRAGDYFNFHFPAEKQYVYGTDNESISHNMGNTIETMHNPPHRNEAEVDGWFSNAYYGATNYALSHPDKVVNACITACNFLCNHFCN